MSFPQHPSSMFEATDVRSSHLEACAACQQERYTNQKLAERSRSCHVLSFCHGSWTLTFWLLNFFIPFFLHSSQEGLLKKRWLFINARALNSWSFLKLARPSPGLAKRGWDSCWVLPTRSLRCAINGSTLNDTIGVQDRCVQYPIYGINLYTVQLALLEHECLHSGKMTGLNFVVCWCLSNTLVSLTKLSIFLRDVQDPFSQHANKV